MPGVQDGEKLPPGASHQPGQRLVEIALDEGLSDQRAIPTGQELLGYRRRWERVLAAVMIDGGSQACPAGPSRPSGSGTRGAWMRTSGGTLASPIWWLIQHGLILRTAIFPPLIVQLAATASRAPSGRRQRRSAIPTLNPAIFAIAARLCPERTAASSGARGPVAADSTPQRTIRASCHPWSSLISPAPQTYSPPSISVISTR
jgi:hypothetical protein